MLFCARVDGGALDGPSSPRDGATWRSRASLFCHFPGARVLAPGARGPRPSARSRVLSPSPLAPVGSCLPLFLGALQTWPVLARWVLLPLLSFGVVPLRRGRPCGGCGSSPRERRAVGRSLNRAGVGPARFSCVFSGVGPVRTVCEEHIFLAAGAPCGACRATAPSVSSCCAEGHPAGDFSGEPSTSSSALALLPFSSPLTGSARVGCVWGPRVGRVVGFGARRVVASLCPEL